MTQIKPVFNTSIIPLLDHPKAKGYQRKSFSLTGALPRLSAALEGMEKGELVVITAPPGAGKTQMARTLCLEFAEQGLSCLYLSYELTYAQLSRLFILSGLEALDARRMIYAPEEYSERDITFVEELAKKNKLDVLVVDDIHSLEERYSVFRRSDNMAVVLRGLADRLKAVAREREMLVITMAHTRKDAINASDSSLSDIAYSGGVAQVADTVLSIKTEKTTGYAVVEITKARWSGAKTKVKCKSVDKKFIELLNDADHVDKITTDNTDKLRRFS
jgi:predicted ATP-dependent serine protease